MSGVAHGIKTKTLKNKEFFFDFLRHFTPKVHMGFLKKCKPFRPAVWTAAIANRNIYNFDPNSCNISIGNEILERIGND